MDSVLFVSEEDYPHDRFAPYIIGAAFMISQDVLEHIVSSVPYFPAFAAEDAYVGMLLDKVGIEPEKNDGFIRHSKPHTWTMCNYRKVLVSLNAMANDFPKMYTNSAKSERSCLPKLTPFLESKCKNETTGQVSKRTNT